MNTTTPAARAGVAVKTTETGFAQHRRQISSDWACLELLRPDDTFIDAAVAYTELGLVVIPDPHLMDSHPLPRMSVKPHWQQHPNARVGLQTGHVFEVLALAVGPQRNAILSRLGSNGLLSSCFAQADSQKDTLLLYASSGRVSQPLGLAALGLRVIGRSGRIDVTPRDLRWRWVEVDTYGDPLDVQAVREVLS